MFNAIYLCALPPNSPMKDATRYGFATYKEAYEYALSFCCEDCRNEELFGEASACMCEWLIESDEDEEEENVQ